MAPSGADSLSHINFESLISRFRELEDYFGYLSDRYLQSLRGQVIMSTDKSVMMSGESILNSIRSHRLRLFDPVSPNPGSSRDGDLVVPFLQSLFWLTRRRFVVWGRPLCCFAVGLWGDGFGSGLVSCAGVGFSVCHYFCFCSCRFWGGHRSPRGSHLLRSLLSLLGSPRWSLLLSPHLSLWVLMGSFVRYQCTWWHRSPLQFLPLFRFRWLLFSLLLLLSLRLLFLLLLFFPLLRH